MPADSSETIASTLKQHLENLLKWFECVDPYSAPFDGFDSLREMLADVEKESIKAAHAGVTAANALRVPLKLMESELRSDLNDLQIAGMIEDQRRKAEKEAWFEGLANGWSDHLAVLRHGIAELETHIEDGSRDVEDAHSNAVDGPTSEGVFNYAGKPLPIDRPMSWRLLKFLWSKRETPGRPAIFVNFNDLCPGAWTIAQGVPDKSAVGSARRDAHHFFLRYGIPYHIKIRGQAVALKCGLPKKRRSAEAANEQE